MSDIQTPTRSTIDEFEAFLRLPENADRRFELIDGEIVEKTAGHLHQLISKILFLALVMFAESRGLGEVLYETRHRADPDDTHNDRLPDVSFTAAARVPTAVSEGALELIPDLCIEIQSPDDYPKEMRDKAAYYLANGAQQVWLVFTKRRWVEVMYRDGNSDAFHMGDILVGGDLLPGFEFAVEKRFAPLN
jgi:Uma2 family endonuclease